MSKELSIDAAAIQFLDLCERRGVQARIKLTYPRPKQRLSTAEVAVTGITLTTKKTAATKKKR